jgi:hypothetical protein
MLLSLRFLFFPFSSRGEFPFHRICPEAANPAQSTMAKSKTAPGRNSLSHLSAGNRETGMRRAYNKAAGACQYWEDGSASPKNRLCAINNHRFGIPLKLTISMGSTKTTTCIRKEDGIREVLSS